MKNKIFMFILAVFLSLCVKGIAFAAIDLDLDEGPAPEVSTMKPAFITISAGYDMNGKAAFSWDIKDFDFSDSDNFKIKNGFSIALEGGKNITQNFGLGGGAAYQVSRAIDESGWDKSKFGFIPLYGLAKFFINAGKVVPFGIVQVGYNFLTGNSDFKTLYYYEWGYDDYGNAYDAGVRWKDTKLKGGLYWGVGAGIMIENGLQIQVLYSVNNGSVEGDKYDYYYEDSTGYWETGTGNAKSTEKIKYSKITISAGYNF